MSANMNELQRRMVSRQLQHHTQYRFLNVLTLVVVGLVASFVSAFTWKESTPPDFGTNAEYPTFYIGSDQKSPAQGEPSKSAPASPQSSAE